MSHEKPEQEATMPAAESDARSHTRDLPEARRTREHLLDAALELFAERGFEATTTKLIAERAGVPNGLIYYYFGTKEKLLESLFAERTFLPDLRTRIASACLDQHTDPRVTLTQICTEFHTALQRNESFVRLLSHEANLRSVAHQQVRQLAEQVITLLEAFLEQAQQQGKLRQLDSTTVAHALFSSILVSVRFRPFAEPHRSIEQLIAALT
jgi:TetR/AcrR family transcriptional regulator, fatty acid metabolism regulator protein